MALQHPNMTVAHRQLTAKEREILEKQVLVHVGIVLPDGTPHVSAMWVDLDGEDIILNTAEGRTKANVLRLGSPVALSVLDPENPYRNLGLRGRVVQVISDEQGAGARINRLAKKYLGGPANRSLELVAFVFWVARRWQIPVKIRPYGCDSVGAWTTSPVLLR